MVGVLAGKTVSCTPTGEPRSYGRVVANCTVEGEDLQAIIVLAGWAFDYTFFSDGKYAADARAARAARRGIWQGSCEYPRTWRQRHAN